MLDIKPLRLVAVAASIAVLSSCASSPGTSSTTTTTPHPSAPANAHFGRVTNVELVSVQQQPASGIGAGAVIGGVVGACWDIRSAVAPGRTSRPSRGSWAAP